MKSGLVSIILQTKLVLRMLTDTVIFVEVLLKVNWEHNNWDNLSKRSCKNDQPDVRTCFVHFLLEFLFEPNPLVLKEFSLFFSLKTTMSSLSPCLMQDEAKIVMLVGRLPGPRCWRTRQLLTFRK